jgi:hypothetical protein
MTKKGKERTVRVRLSRAMSARLKTKVIGLLVESPDMTPVDVALELGISRQRAQAYMGREVRAEAEALAKGLACCAAEPDREARLDEVDRAMMKQARLGNVQAARLVYMRMAQKGEAQTLPTLDELEAELVSLKKMERAKETGDDTGLDDTGAVADDACR